MNVVVAGGTGFVGRPLCRELHERGHDVTAASRSPDGVDLPEGVETVRVDVTEPDLSGLVGGADAVVNLVALPSHVRPRGRSHRAVHLAGTEHLVRASEAAGVDRFVQMSALGVDSGVRTAYFAAKRGAERAVRDSDLDWVIYRPSVVFGDGCAFLPFVERLASARVVPLPGGGDLRIQPMWVGDLAGPLADGVEDGERAGDTYEVGGPERLTMAEVVRLVRPDAVVVPVPMPLARLGAAVAGYVPGSPVGSDQYRVFALDNTVADNDVAAFGIGEADLLTLDEYLSGATP
ncbi:complex I NDUFA9 subunit family protein [Halobacteriales archaeon QS_8_69_26]|nr:MAG: complex I NDUFA9 subunit family protein [Halobacteriales archaeon QS_8_69_26]